MSTIPFRRVEGAIALPNAEVFGRVQATFGHEWVLRLPTIEISALYAAVSQTFCLSSEMFRAICCWDRGRVDMHCMVAKSNADSVLLRAALGDMATPKADVRQDPPRADANSPRQPSWTIALSAGALGGAVLLAWLIAQHMPRGGAAPLAQQAQASNPAPIPAPAMPPQIAAAPVDARAAQAAVQKRARHAVVSEPRTRAQNHVARVETGAVRTRGAGVIYRRTGSHSPRRDVTVPGDDYRSIAMFANTYTSGSRPVAGTEHTDSTGWATRLTQRRVTEVPDQFLK